MLREWDRDTDRRRFAEQVTDGERWSPSGLADRRAQIWSPLSREFADLGRDLLAPPELPKILERVRSAALRAIPGAELAALTLSSPGQPLRTAGATGSGPERAAELDAVQTSTGQGPFHDATRQSGPGSAASPDLAGETPWPDFAAAAAERGLRGLLCAGIFPAGGRTRGALAVYSARPRSVASVEADEVLVLACCAAAALSTLRSADPAELERAEPPAPVRSSAAIERSAAVLVDRRGLRPDAAYEALREACGALLAR